MKSKFLNALLIPVYLALVVGVGCLYWGHQFRVKAHDAEIKYNHLKDAISSVNCPVLNKDVVLAIAHTSSEQLKQFENIFGSFAFVLFVIGFGNLAVIRKYLKHYPPDANGESIH